MSIKWHSFASPAQTGAELAATVAKILTDAIAARGMATLVVSGGSTPIPFFAALQTMKLAWDRITITLTDERFVGRHHADSNEHLLRRHMLHAESPFIPLWREGLSLQECAAAASSDLTAISKPFDVTILGMGEDGHTASLFPHHPQLRAALAADAPDCMAIDSAPKPPPSRLTLSAKRLMSSEHVFIHIAGPSKRAVLNSTSEHTSPNERPIAVFLRHPNAHVYWSKK